MKEETIKILKAYAEKELRSESSDFNPMEWSGGNFDDCFSFGEDQGRTSLAREILESEGIE